MIKRPPDALITFLCILFAVLYGVLILPNTIFLRNFSLITGAILSLPIIFYYRRILFQWRAIPIAFIICLLVWVTFHLLFIGVDYAEQYQEFTKIWKKIAICIPFALGLGLGLLSYKNHSIKTSRYWKIIFTGFLLPTITYFIKWSVTLAGQKYGFTVPIFLVLDPDHMGSHFGISRAWYVFFCLPAVAISIGLIVFRIKQKTFTLTNSFLYLACIPLTLLIFYIENDRLGTLFGFALVLVAFILIGLALIRNRSFVLIIVFVLAISSSMWILSDSFKQNSGWLTLLADARVAIEQVDKLDNWRYNRIQLKGYPINQYGQPVNSSNYERVSWALAGASFVPQHPWGYGLLSLSFGKLCKEKWPDSEMSWSHSAWLDFTLGYGIPGLFLLAGSLILTWFFSAQAPEPWKLLGRWALPIMASVFLVKEISSEIFVTALIFLIVFSACFTLKTDNAAIESSKP